MKTILAFVLQHGYLVLFGNLFAEQIGLPIPAIPVLLAMGALAALGHFSFLLAMFVALLAAFVSDVIWYELGRRRGASILSLLCRISLEPDSCVTNTKNTFGRWGARALIVAKFIPGLSTMAPPMAGMTRMPWLQFVGADLLGTFAWVGGFLGAGYLFSAQLESLAEASARLGVRLGVILAGLVFGYLALKYHQRWKFIRSLRLARVTPQELRSLLNQNADVAIVDLRDPLEVQGRKLPGAILLQSRDLETRHQEIPRDRDVILYCT